MNLIEVLISFSLLAAALLVIDRVNLLSQKSSQTNAYFAIASTYLQTITDQLRIVTDKTDRIERIIEWNHELSHLLPKGRVLCGENYPLYSITIFWGESNNINCYHLTLGTTGCLQKTINVQD